MISTAVLPVPALSPEVLGFAAEKGVAEYLPNIAAMTRRLFPHRRIDVIVADDPELSYNTQIVFEVDDNGMEARDYEIFSQWNAEIVNHCPTTHTHVFTIGMGILNPDETWMRRALELAESGRGAVEPNPLVGAVVVRDGKLVGEGWHRKYGEAHAEVHALAAAGSAARGATLFVTLEPCCHYGKTPPCTDAVLRSGVSRVVAAMSDPFPQVAGKGAEILRSAGVAVEVGLCAAAARRLNAPYLKLLATAKPYVHAKWAMTLDGKIATRTGNSQWISNAGSRRYVHALRGRMDAIIVGVGTVLADDPLLTARPPGPRTPARIILDSRLRTPLGCRLVQTAREVPTFIAFVWSDDSEKVETLKENGVKGMILPGVDGRPDVSALLSELGRRRFTNVLIEGGSAVLGSFLDARAIDEFHVFVAPKLVGGSVAPSPVGGQGVALMSEALQLAESRLESIDGDVLLHGWTAAAGSL